MAVGMVQSELRRVACCVYDRREACPCVDGELEALELNPLEQPKHLQMDWENPRAKLGDGD